MASDCALDLFHLYSVPELLNIGATELPHSSCELLESAAIQAAAERLVRYRRMECQENLGTEQSYYGHLWTLVATCRRQLRSCAPLQTTILSYRKSSHKKNSRICPLEGVGKRVPCLFVYVSLHVDVCCMHACMHVIQFGCVCVSTPVL